MPHYREIRDRIEQKLADAYSRLPRATANKYATLVLASGVRRKDNKTRGVMFEVKAGGSTTTAREILPKPLRPGNCRLSAIGWCNKDILDRLDARMPSAQSIDELRDMMMDTVIETSRLTDDVGDDVMGVIIDKQTDTIKTHFRQADPKRQAQLLAQVGHLGDEFKEMASVSTPCIVIPGVIFRPSVGIPAGFALDNGINFEYSGFNIDPPAGGRGFFAGHPRKPKPKP